MAVMTEKKCVRNSSVELSKLHNVASMDSTNAKSFRALGGTTLIVVGAASTPLTYKFENDDRVGFLVRWASTVGAASSNVAKLEVTQGTEGKGAWQRGLGSFTLTLTASSTNTELGTWMIGPFESARFAHYAESTSPGVKKGQNYISMKFASTAGTTLAAGHIQVLPFRMPDVQYDT